MDAVLNRKLLYILHRGWVEVRLLAQKNSITRIFDLADALEPITGYINNWKDEDLDAIRFNLTNYQEKYEKANCFDYVAVLDAEDPPQRF